jgi:Ca2+-binding RTX toxin-like protein
MFFDTLEPRRMMSVTVTAPYGLLTVVGTGARQSITVGYDQARHQYVVNELDYSTNRNTTRRFLANGIAAISVRGMGGNDIIGVANGVPVDTQLHGGDGNDILYTNSTRRTYMFGDAGNDNLTGNAGDDFFFGGDGHDTMNGMRGADTMWGGTGIDTVQYLTRNENLRIAADNLPYSGAPGERDVINTDVEGLVGGNGADQLIGGAGNETLRGGAGNDTLWGMDGNDVLYGDDGDDQLACGNGHDTAFGGAGNDSVWGMDGNDLLYGQDGNDFIVGGAGRDQLLGGRGADTLDARDGAGIDTAWGNDWYQYDGSIDVAYRDLGDWVNDVDRVY